MGAKPRAQPTWVGLADPWRHWVVEALRGGAEAATLVSELAERGVPQDVAAREVDVIASATAPLRARVERAEKLIALLAELEDSGGAALDRVEHIASDAFYADYFRTNRPLVLTDPWRGRAPLAAWSLEALAESHGGAMVNVAVGRNENMAVVVDPRNLSERMTLAEVIAAALDEPERDLYIVSRNLALEGPLSSLYDTLVDLPAPLEPPVRERVSLWLGPAGTHTPLHHDTTNVFFCQMAGAKRIRLVSSRELSVLHGTIESSFYAVLDTDEPSDANVHEVTLEAGQALFIPVGWWHQVDAITPSVSLSFTNLRLPNRFEWYRPGDCR